MRSVLVLAGVVCLIANATAKPQDVTHYENNENSGASNWQNGHHGSELDKFFISYPLKANWFHAFQTCRFKKSFLVSVESSSKRELVAKYIESLKLNNGK